ncbi:MAG: CvpA family protein [Candidatus Deferrimicrobiaceae bacterium]
MNLLDLLLAVLIAWFAVSGIVRGLVRQLFSLGGLVAGHLLGVRYYAFAQGKLGLSFQYAEVVGYAVVFLAVYLVVRLIGGLIEGRVRTSKLSGTDRLAGMAAGLVKGALLSIRLVFLLVILLPRDARLLRESKAGPTAVAAGKRFAAAFPERFAESFREKVRSIGPHALPPPAAPGVEPSPRGKGRPAK